MRVLLIVSAWTVVAPSAAPAFATPPPPPPPPVAEDPAVRASIETAQVCFRESWEAHRPLRFAAEAAVETLSGQVGAADWLKAREVVAAYTASRSAILKCMTSLDEVFQRATSDHDRLAVRTNSESMWFSYTGQTPYELRILRVLSGIPAE